MSFHCHREEFGMASISERERREIEAANAAGTDTDPDAQECGRRRLRQ